MKLKKFVKNKKQKQIVIGSIIGILLLIGGITLYRTFALYEVEKTFNVLEGTVPDFVYKENILNGADPVLKSSTGAKLIPVTIDENDGTVRKADIKDEWYSYAKKRWANAVILVDGVTEPKNDEEIPEEEIESYFVWIPKYRYKIFDMGKYDELEKKGTELENKAKPIEIKFGLEDTKDNVAEECKTPGKSGEEGTCKEGYWMTHPAFLAFNTNGFWVGKFETGYEDANSSANAQSDTNEPTKVIIKPNVYSWRGITIGNAYRTSYEYERELDSHMMKNTEWGAVAYLTQSIYGRCTKKSDGTTCEAVTKNNNSNFVTGYAAKDMPADGTLLYYEAVLPNVDGAKTLNYENKESLKASTTGNYNGIYDINGGAWEKVAGVMTNVEKPTSKEQILFQNSGLTKEDITDLKYVDLYATGTSVQYNKRILGDATGELGPFGYSNYSEGNTRVGSWYTDFAWFIEKETTWFIRGGQYHEYGELAGIFAFCRQDGNARNIDSFRIVLTP